MKQTLRQELVRHRLLLISLAISTGLLIAFLIFQYKDLKFLSLEIKWLIVCGLPILIGLFIGGYIKTFKGFGLELETNLKEPIPLSIVSKVDMTESPGMNKETLHRLQQLGDAERNKINRLRFIYGKTHYYDPYAVEEHYRTLKNLRFIEVINSDGDFLYLLPLSKFKTTDGFNQEKIQQFINSIERQNLVEEFHDIVSDFVLTSDNIIDVYKKISKSNQSKILFSSKEVLPILNEKNKMIGTVDKQKVEAKITEEVIKIID